MTLQNATIYYNFFVAHNTDIDNIENTVETKLNSILSSVTLCDARIT